MECANCKIPQRTKTGWSVLGILSQPLAYCPSCSKNLLRVGTFMDLDTGELYDAQHRRLLVCHTLEELEAAFPFWFEMYVDTLIWDEDGDLCTEMTLYKSEMGGHIYYTIDSPWGPDFDYDPSDLAEVYESYIKQVLATREHIRAIRQYGLPSSG